MVWPVAKSWTPNIGQYLLDDSKMSKRRNLVLTNAINMVKSSACNEALLVRRATKRSTTAMQARDRHIAYDAMMSGARS